LRKLIKLSTSSTIKNLSEAEIADLAKLYRCVHRSGKVIWISGDDDAQILAKKLEFIVPDLKAFGPDVSDDEEEEPDEDKGPEDRPPGTAADTKSAEPDADRPNMRETQEIPLPARVQNLEHRRSLLDERVADISTTVSALEVKYSIPPQSLQRASTSPSVPTSPSCIIL
jgi:hypothetical protein